MSLGTKIIFGVFSSKFQRNVFLKKGGGVPQMLRNFRGGVRDFVTTRYNGGGGSKIAKKFVT